MQELQIYVKCAPKSYSASDILSKVGPNLIKTVLKINAAHHSYRDQSPKIDRHSPIKLQNSKLLDTADSTTRALDEQKYPQYPQVNILLIGKICTFIKSLKEQVQSEIEVP